MSILKTAQIQSLAGARILGSTGGILQVVSNYYSSTFTTTSLTFVDVTGFSVAITPQSSTNKILILGHIAVGATTSTSTGHKLLCNGVEIYPNTPTENRFSGWCEFTNNDTNVQRNSPFVFLHSPGTTSTQTYQLQIKANDAGGTATVNRGSADTTGNGFSNRTASSITVMEIVA
jgi:hypothetical protein